MTSSARRLENQRTAYVLITVLVCLTLVMALGTAWLRAIGLERAHIRADQYGAQAEFLAASALSRAAARLADDANYTGEQWQVDRGALGGSSDATVKIEVAAVPERPDERRVNVAAEYPASGTLRARRSRESVVRISSSNTRQESSP